MPTGPEHDKAADQAYDTTDGRADSAPGAPVNRPSEPGQAPSRRHGRNVRPDPPRAPRGGQRGRRAVPPRRGRVRADRPAVAEDPPHGLAGRGPLSDDGHRDRREPAVLRQPHRHRPRRPHLHHRTPCATCARSTPTRTSSSSPAPTRSARSSPGATPRNCSPSRTSSGSPGPGTPWPTRACPRAVSRSSRSPPWPSPPQTAVRESPRATPSGTWCRTVWCATSTSGAVPRRVSREGHR